MKKIKSTKRGRVGLDTGNYAQKDSITKLAIASAEDDAILLFTNVGKVYRMNLDDEKSVVINEDTCWPSEAKNVAEILETNSSSFEKDEKIVSILPIKNPDFEEELFFFMSTEQGMLKKLEFSQLLNITRAGKKVITLFEGDYLSHVIKIGETDDILIGVSSGHALRFSAESVRTSGRNSAGVKSIKLDSKSNARIVSLSSTSNPEEALVLSIDEEGKGKCTSLQEFRLTSRRSSGTIAYKLGIAANALKTKKSSKPQKVSLIVCSIVHPNEEVILLSNRNKINRIAVGEITVRSGRNTAGTILVRLEDMGEKLSHFVKFESSEI